MDLETLPGNDWIRAATLAHMVLSQAITDELLDELTRPTPVQPVRTSRAA
jgi:hypothetical protein